MRSAKRDLLLYRKTLRCALAGSACQSVARPLFPAGVRVDGPPVHGNPTDRATTLSGGHPFSSAIDAAEISAQPRSRCSPLDMERMSLEPTGERELDGGFGRVPRKAGRAYRCNVRLHESITTSPTRLAAYNSSCDRFRVQHKQRWDELRRKGSMRSLSGPQPQRPGAPPRTVSRTSRPRTRPGELGYIADTCCDLLRIHIILPR